MWGHLKFPCREAHTDVPGKMYYGCAWQLNKHSSQSKEECKMKIYIELVYLHDRTWNIEVNTSIIIGKTGIQASEKNIGF